MIASARKKKIKEADLYSAFIEIPYTQGAQVRITQCYLQTTPYLPLRVSPWVCSMPTVCWAVEYLPEVFHFVLLSVKREDFHWQVVDVTYGLFVWPCAPLLAKYVFHHQDFVAQKHVLEVSMHWIHLFSSE